MKTLQLAAWAALLCVAPCLADSVSDPAHVEASLDTGRLSDDLSGSIADPAKEIRVTTYVSAGSTVSPTLTTYADEGTPITGISLTLCDAAGADQHVTGSSYDRSVAGSGVITWKKVPLATAGNYTFIIRGASAGDWHLKQKGTLATVTEKFTSTENLGVSVETHVDFHGLRGSSVQFTLSPGTNSKFKGELVSVLRPDGSPIAGTPIAAKGKVLLDVDGVHHLVLRNVGGGIGSWTAKTTTTPPSLVKRRGYVRPAATALLPVVTKVSPSSDYHKDQTAAVTLTGRDLQPGADVRLVRRGFADILATDIIVDSETSLRCSLDLATAPETGVDSIGVWKLGMWNAPVYTTPGDRTTLVKDSATDDQKKTFECRSASSITLPPGVRADTEVWHIKFNSDFQGDLNRMGLGSDDSVIEGLMRDAVEAYTVCFLRTLMRANETTGKLSKNTSPSISFIVGSVPSAAGTPGEDYNRIEVGGEWQQGDEHDPTEPLDWGSSPIDAGNAHPDDLSVEVSDGNGGTKRVGRGARTRILDPGAVMANADWVSAMAPLRGAPLTGNDRPMFANSFRPATTSRANRYRTMVLQMTRASREIAALIAHHIGRAMGLPAGGDGPMANPTTAGAFWITTPSLTFTPDDLAKLRGAAKVNVLPGNSASLTVGYFPLIATPTPFLPNCKTQVPYTVDWNYSGGRANAVEGDYGVKYSGGNPPLDLTVSVRGITGTARLYLDASQALFYCNIHYFRVTATDTVRDTATSFIYRLNVLPNLALLRAGQEYNNAVNCQNAILATL